MPLTQSGGYGVPREIVLPTSTIAFLGGNFACPNNSKEYLRLIYGDFGEVVYTYVDTAAAKTRGRADAAESVVVATGGSMRNGSPLPASR